MPASDNRYLTGNYAPVEDELSVENLPMQGEIPAALQGVYMRNGPNPAFPPISYTYPLDGDGMIHAVYLKDGKATYKNRFVQTKGLLAEKRAGHTIYGGVMKPIFDLDPKLIGQDGDPGPIKDGAFIHVIRHAQHYLAMWESGPAYEITRNLDTKGEWCPTDGKRPFNVNAHTRLDPDTGNLFLFTYNFTPPYLSYYVLNPSGKLIKEVPIEKNYPTMMHDFVLTKNYAVFFDCPAIFDLAALQTGGQILQWRPELPVRIGLIHRETGAATWIETDAFFVYHYANAFEKNDSVIIDFVCHGGFSLNPKDKSHPPKLFRSTINLKTKKIAYESFGDNIVEFPRINENHISKYHRYVYVPTYAESHLENQPFNGLAKFDTEQKHLSVHDFGADAEIGEAVFVPKKDAMSEDDGYLMLFVYNRKENKSEFVLLAAQDLSQQPLVKIKLPRRVPHGLHGTWMPD